MKRGFLAVWTGFMRDPASGLRRISLPRTPVNNQIWDNALVGRRCLTKVSVKRRPKDNRERDIQNEIESAIDAPFDCHLLVEPSALRVGPMVEHLRVIINLYDDKDPHCDISVLACQRCEQPYLYSYVGVFSDRWGTLTPILEEEAMEAVALAETIRPYYDSDRIYSVLRFARRLATNRPYMVQSSLAGLAEGKRNPYEEWGWASLGGYPTVGGLPLPLSYGPTL
jgi:hypothetical protein